MAAKNEDLHGNAPDKASVALLLIDVINDLEFPEGDQLLRHALPMARQIAALKARAHQGGIPAIYVNDNFGRWRSDFSAQVVILTGLAANICVLFTANDAYMRDFNLIVPRDCVASNTDEENAYALDQMNKILKADTRPSAEIPLEIEPQSSEARSRSTPRVI